MRKLKTTARIPVRSPFIKASVGLNELTLDSCHYCSLDTHELAPQREMGITTLCAAFVYAVMYGIMALFPSSRVDIDALSTSDDIFVVMCLCLVPLGITNAFLFFAAARRLNHIGIKGSEHYCIALFAISLFISLTGQEVISLMQLIGSAVQLALCLILTLYGGKYVGRKTDLMRAAIAGNLEKVKLLVNAGADKGIVSERGYTALEYAKLAGHSDIVAFLEGQK